eukprot:27686_1
MATACCCAHTRSQDACFVKCASGHMRSQSSQTYEEYRVVSDDSNQSSEADINDPTNFSLELFPQNTSRLFDLDNLLKPAGSDLDKVVMPLSFATDSIW